MEHTLCVGGSCGHRDIHPFTVKCRQSAGISVIMQYISTVPRRVLDVRLPSTGYALAQSSPNLTWAAMWLPLILRVAAQRVLIAAHVKFSDDYTNAQPVDGSL